MQLGEPSGKMRCSCGRFFNSRNLKFEDGFSYLWLLMLLTVMSISLATIGPLWALSVEREREQELLHIGILYAHAIEDYYQSSPGVLKKYPSDVSQLILDTRFTTPIRHLRQLYTDPINPGRQFEVLSSNDGGIIGVFSKSDASPHLKVAWSDGGHVIGPAQHYSDWKFLASVTNDIK